VIERAIRGHNKDRRTIRVLCREPLAG
jgi:hypothetical protein